MNTRPDPDELLRFVQAEEPARGRLKIFLGYAAGVGKTYAMLEAAHQRQADGVDVVVGYIETHGRVETEALLQNLEVLPRKQVEYRGISLPELDVDAAMARRPDLVLVDEFAHTNAPGSRHAKRYLDVAELLDAGINVYTTLNIQHLESLNDVVAQVTGVIVRETIPDRVIDEAAEIEVIDLPPDELLTRLQDGKVYVPEQAARAIEKFFRKGNLTALREMSLRRAAEQVDDQMRAYMQTRAILGPWPAGERLLVCLTSSPLAEKLVRTTRRLADELNAEWFAVYVEIASRPEIHQENRLRIGKMMQLVEELGGKAFTVAGHSIHEAVLEYAHKYNITKIVVGKSPRPRWQERLAGSVVEQLIQHSGDIDVYVISGQPDLDQPPIPAEWQPHRPWSRYLVSLGMVALATLLGSLARVNLEPANLVMLYLTVVVISAIYLGRGPSLLAALAGVLAFDFFLVPPYLTFAVSDTQYVLTFVGLFVVSLVISTLTTQVREQAEAAIRREAQTSVLYNLGKDLTSAIGLEQVSAIIIEHIVQIFGRQVAIFLPENGRVKLYAASQGYTPDENDLAVATWTFQHDQPAGRGTDTLPAAQLRCHPLKTARGLVGVLGVRPVGESALLTPEQRQTLTAFANQAALAIERDRLAEQAHQAELLQATEKLQGALLNSISHDLRTPLVSITGALSSLTEEGIAMDEEGRRSLLQTARDEADRLNRLVGNLLNMTRLEAGAMHINREPYDVQDVIGAALEQLGERLQDHPVKVVLAPDLPMVWMDFSLIVQMLVNLLDNAVKYSPPQAPPGAPPIELNAHLVGDRLHLEVCDRGVGIPPEDLQRVFDKFYRVQRPVSVGGTGLGLAICKGIVEAHGGTIQAEQRPGGGTEFRIDLPVEAKDDGNWNTGAGGR
jgi:two-component system, OmpR family, sensor histidine kinase KdpD